MDEDRAASGPRRSGLVQERSRRTRRALVDAALAFWTERGFDDGIDDTTVEEIAEAAGVTKGTFYFHFAHKEDILLEIGWGTAEAMYKETTKYLADEVPVEEAFDKLMTSLARRISAGPRVAVGRTIAEFYRRPLPWRRSRLVRTTGSSGPTPSCSRGRRSPASCPTSRMRARSPRCSSR